MDEEDVKLAWQMAIFNVWVGAGLTKHRKINGRMKRYMNQALLDYSYQEICEAIETYAIIVKHPDSWYKFKYSLDNFLAYKYHQFLNREDAIEMYTNKGRKPKGQVVDGVYSPPTPSTISPDFKEKFIEWKQKKSQQK